MNEDKSKSERKRDAMALQVLGEKIAALPERLRAEIPLPPAVLDAIALYHKTNHFVAKKRAVQTIGARLRELEEMGSIQAAYDKITQANELNTARFALIETWRARLMSDDKAALTLFLQDYPCDDIQHLRHLIQKANAERDKHKSPGAQKALFQFIRGLMS